MSLQGQSGRPWSCLFLCVALLYVMATGEPAAAMAQSGRSSVAVEQTVTSSSGQTVVQLAKQLLSGARLRIVVATLPHALVRVAIGYSDGHTTTLQKRSGPRGRALFNPLISYQPQGGADTLTVTITVKNHGRIVDTLQGTVSLVQRVQLSGTITFPAVVYPHRHYVAHVHASVGDTLVTVQVVYPNGRLEAAASGETDGRGNWRRRIVLSGSQGRGRVEIVAQLRYQGIRAQAVTWTLVR